MPFLSSAVLQMAEVRTLEFWMKTHNVSAETGGPYRVRLQRKEGGGQSISFYLKRIKKHKETHLFFVIAD